MAGSRILFLSWLLVSAVVAFAQDEEGEHKEANNYFIHKTKGHSYNDPEWQTYADSALMIDPKAGWIWQIRSMPYFKDGDYGSGMRYLDKAVALDTGTADYRGFMKAIFMKDYEGAIKDFLYCKEHQLGMGLMDHSYDFFLGISYKEIGDLGSAEHYLLQSIEAVSKKSGDDWVHYNEWFYLGMVYLQQHRYGEAIVAYNKCIKQFPGFPNALYHRAIAEHETGQTKAALASLAEGKRQALAGVVSNEDNDFYVNFPDEVYVADFDVLLAQWAEKSK